MAPFVFPVPTRLPEKDASAVRFRVWNRELQKLNVQSSTNSRFVMFQIWKCNKLEKKLEYKTKKLLFSLRLDLQHSETSSRQISCSIERLHHSHLLKDLQRGTNFLRWKKLSRLSFRVSRFQTQKRTPPASFSGANWQILCFSEDNIDYLIKSLNI